MTAAFTSFDEDFTTPSWIEYTAAMGSAWPPGPGATGPQYSGMWSRIMFDGWPTLSGISPAVDCSARNQVGSNDAQCYEEPRSATSPYGLVLTAENVPGVEFPQFPWQSGTVVSNPNRPFTLGLFQVKMWVPAGVGFDRAAVIYDADVANGWDFEADWPEIPGIGPDGKPSNTAVRFGAHDLNNSVQPAPGVWGNVATPFPGLHNFALDMADPSGSMVCYIDNAPVGSLPLFANMKARNQFIVQFALAVGNAQSWEGAPAAGVTSATMMVRRFTWHAAGTYKAGALPFLDLPAK